MPRIRGAIVIARPVEVVFDVVADESNRPLFDSRLLRVDRLTGGPVGIGSRWAALEGSGRWPTSVLIECTECGRPDALGWTTTMPDAEIRTRLTFEPVAEGTRVTWDREFRTSGRFRLYGVGAARGERAVWARLKALLESSADVPRLAPEAATAA